MIVNSRVIRTVHLYLGASEEFLMEGIPLLQKKDKPRAASISVLDITAELDDDNNVIYEVIARGIAVNHDGARGSVDRTFKFTGLDYLPEDISDSVELLFRQQLLILRLQSGNPNKKFEVVRKNGPTNIPVLKVMS